MTERFCEANGQTLAIREQPGEGVPVVFVHATGFHGLCWNQIIARLPGRHCIAPDLRGHGRSSKPAPPYSWKWFGEDVAALARALGLDGCIGVGHSMGGHSLVLAATLEPRAFSDLILLDPVIMEPEYYRAREPLPHFARKRRNRWESPDQMFESFRERMPFREWDPAVLRDYCNGALLPDGGSYVLACPPEVEGSIYENSGQPEANLYGVLDQVQARVKVLRSAKGRLGMEGPMDMLASPTAPDLAARLPHGEDILLEGRSHFIPMEDPTVVARSVAECDAKAARSDG